MERFIQNVPQAGEVIGDLLADSQDWKNKEVVGQRLEALTNLKYPGLIPPDEEIKEEDFQAIVGQLQQQLQQVTQEKDQAIQVIEQQEIQKEIEQLKQEAALERELIKSETTIEKQEMVDETNILTQKIDTKGEITEEVINSGEDFEARIKAIEKVVNTK